MSKVEDRKSGVVCGSPRGLKPAARRSWQSIAPVMLLLLSGVMSPVALGQSREPAAVEVATHLLRGQGLTPKSIRSGNYHVLYTCRKAFAQRRKTILEKTRTQFLGFMRRLDVETNSGQEKLLVIVLDSAEQMRRFHLDATGDELSSWIAGYYSPERNWAVFYNQRKSDDILAVEQRLEQWALQLTRIPGGPDVIVEVATDRGVVSKSKRQVAAEMQAAWSRIIQESNQYNTVVTQHEGAHQLAFNVGVQERYAAYPFWVSEGLACVFESPPSKKKGNRRGAARVNSKRLAEFRELQAAGRALGIVELLSASAQTLPTSVDALYAESWAVFAFLFEWHPKELSAYMQALSLRRRGQDGDAIDEAAAFAQHFKVPIDELQREFERYIKTRRDG